MYQKYVDAYHHGDDSDTSYTVPPCRLPPPCIEGISPPSINKVVSVLVRTGVASDTPHSVDHSHKDFINTHERLRTPTATTDDILQAVEYILLEENMA